MNQIAHRKQESYLQISLFETEDPRLTNTLDLWDIAPRFVFYTDRKGGDTHLKSLKRNCEHGGVNYSILLLPGRLILPGGEELDKFPGERESIVEDVLMRLASERNRLAVNKKGKVGLSFTLYEVREELKEVGHTLSLSEIREALHVLHTSIVQITQSTGPVSSQLLSSAALPVLALRRRGDDERHYLEFNPLIDSAIKCQHYRLMNYERLMSLKGQLARWLYKKLCQPNMGAPPPPSGAVPGGIPAVSMSARDIATNGGVKPRSRSRDLLRFVSEAVDALVKAGLLEPAPRHYVREGRQNVDIVFDMVPTPMFLEELHRADRVAADGRRRLLSAAGTDEPEHFLQVEPGDSARLRSERRRLVQAAPAFI